MPGALREVATGEGDGVEVRLGVGGPLCTRQCFDLRNPDAFKGLERAVEIVAV
ncbi:hypothetical protein [Streptomyces sp. ISL-10]|uniref:hypothetical protein n=1 Tax=Streptomyces sp. ISL-10 TaxID=2819172 RepID=UPI0020356BD1|nr:hypothetical protein [Streptomyces sp. ISL-10]